MSVNKYSELFHDMLGYLDFALDKDSYGWYLVDLQKANLGDIESERFDDAEALIDRLDGYIEDCIVRDIVDELHIEFVDELQANWANLVIAAREIDKLGTYTQEIDILDMVCHHAEEVSLFECMSMYEKKCG